MLILQTEKLIKSYGTKEVLNTERLSLYEGDRIGLVGENGSGKTTLLSILAGEQKSDSGTMTCHGTIAYIPQLTGEQLSISSEQANKWRVASSGEMSGGERTRLKVASALEKGADVIIADEPTSHLDLTGIEQLETEIAQFKGAVLLTSHDKTFLNHCCTVIWEISGGKIAVYEGNYDAYLLQAKQKQDKAYKEYEEYTAERKRLKQAAKQLQEKSNAIKKAPSRMGNSEARLHKRSSGKQKAKLNRSAEAMLSRVDQLEHKNKPIGKRPVQFNIAAFPVLHNKRAIQMDVYDIYRDGKHLKRVKGEVLTGSRVAILGENGVGKSTLLECIVNRQVGVATQAKIGYFKQGQEDLDESKTILGNVKANSPYDETFIRTILARLAFKEEDVYKRVAVLSGGERVRTALAKVFLGHFNLLVLDEPTNYLDLKTKESLTEVLKAYPGTIVFVTHDRSLTKDLATYQLSFYEEEPVITEIADSSVVKVKETQEDDSLLMIDLKLTETISKLAVASNEAEKEELDRLYQVLLEKKKAIRQH